MEIVPAVPPKTAMAPLALFHAWYALPAESTAQLVVSAKFQLPSPPLTGAVPSASQNSGTPAWAVLRLPRSAAAANEPAAHAAVRTPRRRSRERRGKWKSRGVIVL